MLVNSTVELVTLWASSSPSLMAFCFSQVIIAVLLLGSRGCAAGVNGPANEGVMEGSEAETPDAAAQIRGSERDSGGHDIIVTVNTIGGSGCAPQVHGHAEECSAVKTQAREESSGQEDITIAADTLLSEEKCGDDDEQEDQLMMRAEEFIQRMNRVWRTESVRVG